MRHESWSSVGGNGARSLIRALPRQPYDEPRIARLRLHIDLAAELLGHDAMHDLEPQARPRTLRLGGKKCVEDARQCLRGNAAAMVADAYHQPVRLGPRGDFDLAFQR